ncbi:MAG TPA: glycosyltransferase, partial [Methylocella sp.]|nr:glycosyltransferase [Methylocella sp.]
MKPLLQTIRLEAVSGVEGENGSYIATGVRPWLSIEPLPLFKPGGWFRMRYRLGLYDDPARPLVSYRRGEGETGWHILPGPVLGRADWFDKAPQDATAVWISPVAKKGPFNFAVEEIEPLPALDVLRLGWRHGRSRLLSAIGTFLLGWQPETDENLRWSISGKSLSAWSEYRSCYSAAASLDGFERPRSNWADAPIVRLYAILDAAAEASEIDATIGSLLSQIYPRWSLTVLGASLSPEVNDLIKSVAAKDPRVTALGQGSGLTGNDADFVSPLSWGDRLAPHALACFIEASQQAAAAQVFYCDEEADTEQGPVPVFKPCWSPRLQSGKPYVGRPLLTRLGHARRRVSFSGGWPGHMAFAENILRGLWRHEVQHIRRMLVRTAPGPCGVLAPLHGAPGSTRGPDASLTESPSVTIVLATRDRPRYLRQTLAGILSATRYERLDLVIVDNGSTDLQALAELDAAARDPRVRLLRSPGAFNFSALNNFGARHAQGRILIFLNNDMAIIDPDWVHELALLASEPEAGAVGCKLLYPGGR